MVRLLSGVVLVLVLVLVIDCAGAGAGVCQHACARTSVCVRFPLSTTLAMQFFVQNAKHQALNHKQTLSIKQTPSTKHIRSTKHIQGSS